MQTFAEPLLTVDSLEGAPDDGNRYEVIQGELHVASAPSWLHQDVLYRLLVAIGGYLEANPIGLLRPGVGVILDEFNGVIPDLVFVTNQRRDEILAGGRLMGPPEIAVEILSPGASNERRDREIKRELYLRKGVLEYWIADQESRTIEVHKEGTVSVFAI